ncbi:DsbA family oxidoreductase [Sanguibacter suaedae]|uniref:DsbA family oxidoreductase n=1 Tax=Sanguibacter suaedae TaxID=2795737 RepID=A0A934I0T5_9MICO|nr:DsbA family oxidoreductase [Sanguibacter suaedae]MBI9113479.1 DsbA family oxidoreductase [Sanguibacter suaedae]
MNALKVDVWSDIACPWCYIGKRRLEEAAATFRERTGTDVEVEYHSFELSPDTPVDFAGSTVDFLAHHKGMPRDQVATMLEQVTGIARSVGLDYDFDALHHTKTLKGHELLHHAKAHGLQGEMKERLLRAYFTEGRHVGDLDTLVELAAEVGLDAEDTREALESGRHAEDVAVDIAQARAYGIQGVPFFVVDSRYGVSGAQEPAVLLDVLERATTERAVDA